MSVAASVALAVAERVERTAGARAGLRAWKALARNTADPEVRGRAILAGLRCAIGLREREQVTDLVGAWRSVDRGVWDRPVIEICQALARAGFGAAAIDLAAIESRHRRSARVLYLHARCLERERASERSPRTILDPEIVAVLEDAIRRAENEGAKDVEVAARVRRAVILGRSWSTRPAALEEAQRVGLGPELPIDLRLETVQILLGAPSRFVRAGAIAALDAIVSSGGADAERALRLAARFADAAGTGLSSLEVDRLVALFGREAAVRIAPRALDQVRRLGRIATATDETTRRAALAAAAEDEPALAASHARAREIVSGRFEPVRAPASTPPSVEGEARRTFRHDELLDLVVALRDARTAPAVTALRALSLAAEAGEVPPRSLVDVGERALRSEDADVRTSAGRLFEVLLRAPAPFLAHPTTPAGGAPPRGYLSLSVALLGAGFPDLALVARRSAMLGREPGAAEALGTTLARQGWELARAGDRAAAIATLREAREVLGSSG